VTKCDANAIFRTELTTMGVTNVSELPVEKVFDLAHRYAIWIPTATVTEAPWIAPYALRKVRIRTEPHAPGNPRDLWGTPTPDGYFTDDNSLIKPVVLRRKLRNSSSPYGTAAVTQGLVCCHFLAGTTTDPMLFSFIPNLVWLPKDLASLTDAHTASEPHPLHDYMKTVSRERYRAIMGNADRARVEGAWNALSEPTRSLAMPDPNSWNELADPAPLTRLIVNRLKRIVSFLDATLGSGPRPKRFSRRYHAGVGPRIDPSVWPVQDFVSVETRASLVRDLRRCVGTIDRGDV
jgi:hypothetical protein